MISTGMVIIKKDEATNVAPNLMFSQRKDAIHNKFRIYVKLFSVVSKEQRYKILDAIHNQFMSLQKHLSVVSKSKDTRF